MPRFNEYKSMVPNRFAMLDSEDKSSMRFVVCVMALATFGCNARDAKTGIEPEPPAQGSVTDGGKANAKDNAMENNGAFSPAGDEHPGEILHEDKIDARTWTRAASEVPPTIAWVQVDGVWHAVVRIEITGTADRRRMTKFGADGAMLETTIQAPPSNAAPRSTPVPVPTPGQD